MSDWDELWNEAKRADLVDLAGRLGVKLKRSGPDWVGPCPAGCADDDGFVVTPQKQIFLCRPSGATGDAVDMVEHAKGLAKREALEFVTGHDLPRSTAAENGSFDGDDTIDRLPPETPPAPAGAGGKRVASAIDRLIKRAKPIAGTYGEDYLRVRGLSPQKRLTRDLLFIPDLDFWIAGDRDAPPAKIATLPAMIGVIRNAAGDPIGVHRTYLDPVEPRKWTAPDGGKAKKFLGDAKGGLIRFGRPGDKLAIGEGIETTLAWYALGLRPEDVSIACGLSLDNIAGGCTGTILHQTALTKAGKPARIANGDPDPKRPGVILPEGVRELILLGDGDSDFFVTRAKILAAYRRFRADGVVVSVHFAPAGKDWADVQKERKLAEVC